MVSARKILPILHFLLVFRGRLVGDLSLFAEPLRWQHYFRVADAVAVAADAFQFLLVRFYFFLKFLLISKFLCAFLRFVGEHGRRSYSLVPKRPRNIVHSWAIEISAI